MTIKKIISTAAGAALLAAAGTVPASAVPLNLTWAPSASSPALSTNAPNITFDDITIQDLATIILTPITSGPNAGGFSGSETGYLPATAFNGLTPLGLNGSLGANPYGIYGEFSGSFTVSAAGTGTFSSATFQLVGDPGYKYSSNSGGFVFNATTGQVSTSDGRTPNQIATGDVMLASGTLVGGAGTQNLASFQSGIPGANITTSFVQQSGEGGFFISPPATVDINLFGSFTNNTTQVACFAASSSECGGPPEFVGGLPSGVPAGDILLEIGGSGIPGGGSADFVAAPVPEPASLVLLGTGLIGLGAVVRRRRNPRG